MDLPVDPRSDSTLYLASVTLTQGLTFLHSDLQCTCFKQISLFITFISQASYQNHMKENIKFTTTPLSIILLGWLYEKALEELTKGYGGSTPC